MKLLRPTFAAGVAVAATILALLVSPAPAHASFTQPFAATSGDACRYGATQGTLTWRYSTGAPIRPITVEVRGSLFDQPFPGSFGFACRDDRYYSVATFTAYTFGGVVSNQSRADNQVINFSFTLGSNSTTAGLSRLTVQVCRYPLYSTQPPLPGYCGLIQHYAPPVYDPPPPSV